MAFERCAYVEFQEYHYLLKDIRAVCVLPRVGFYEVDVIHTTLSDALEINMHARKKPYHVRQRTRSFLRSSISTLITSCSRDLHCSLDEGMRMVMEDVKQAVAAIELSYTGAILNSLAADDEFMAALGVSSSESSGDSPKESSVVDEDQHQIHCCFCIPTTCA